MTTFSYSRSVRYALIGIAVAAARAVQLDLLKHKIELPGKHTEMERLAGGSL